MFYAIEHRVIKINKFSIKRNFSGNKKDLRALTLAGPTRENPILNPLALHYLDNELCMFKVVK